MLADFRAMRRMLRAWRGRGGAAFGQGLTDEPSPLHSIPLLTKPLTGARGILVVDRALPRYDRDAGSRSSYQYVKLFRDMGMAVYFLPNDQLVTQPYADALTDLGVRILAGPGFRCGGWKRWVQANAQHLHVVFLHRPNVAPHYMRPMRRLLPHATLCYCGHDLRFWRDARQYAVTGERFLQGESRYWERIETAICRQVDVSYYFSQAETEELHRRVPGAPVRAIPLFPGDMVETEPDYPFEVRAGILFVGGFDHQPNVDAVQWLVGEILPRIRDVLPAAKVHIVGANPPADIRAWHSAGIAVEGMVSEARLRALYRSCRVAIAPMRFGAGVKGKVVEAMNHGLPMVTTPIGAEGIQDSASCLAVADSAGNISALLTRLYTDRSAWEAVHARLLARHERGVNREALVRILARDFRLPSLVGTSDPAAGRAA